MNIMGLVGFGDAAQEVSNPANARGQEQVSAQIKGKKCAKSTQLRMRSVLLSHQLGFLTAAPGAALTSLTPVWLRSNSSNFQRATAT